MMASPDSTGAPSSPGTVDWLAANPFPGLRAFQPGEADRFFGREQQVAELVALMAQRPFVAVSGASGCGKSSLVLAGLLQALQPAADATAAAWDAAPTHWRPVVLRPGGRPIAHLAAALAPALRPLDADPADDPARIAALNGRLRLGGLGLAEAVRLARLPPRTRVLVVVDQFEEIFRFRRVVDADEASAFVKLLLQATAPSSTGTDSGVSVLVTLRSDTLGACADFPDLPEAVGRGGYLVPRLSRDQRKAAIVRPVALRQAQIAPRLVQRLLNDVSDDYDDLPVMQHVLSRCWQHWARAGDAARPIDLADYDAVGTAAHALSHHADEACDSLGALGQPGGLVERVFRALTERGADGSENRRPLRFATLCAVCGGDAQGTPERGPDAVAQQVAQVLARFRQADTAFLMPPPAVPLADDPVIDISHESLIRLWQRLRGWVTAEAEAAAELQRLLHDARAHAQDGGELWRGRSLAHANAWLAANRPNPAWVALCTGGGSGSDGAGPWAQAQAFLAESQASSQRELRRARWQRRGLVGLGALVIAVSVGAAFNGHHLQRQAHSRELANRALLEMVQDPARSAHLALGAVAQDPDNPRAQYALRQAMAMLEVAQTEQILRFDAPVADARYNGDRSRLVVAAGRQVQLLDAGTLQRVASVTAPATVARAWLLAGQVLTLTEDGQLQLQGLDGGVRARLSCPGSGNTAYTAAASPAQPGAAGQAAQGAQGAQPAQSAQAAQVAVGCYDGALLRWTVTDSGATPQTLVDGDGERTPTVTALAFSADGAWLAGGDNGGNVRVWPRGVAQPRVGRPTPGATPLHHEAAVRDLSFHPANPSLLATASDDRSARVWTLDLAAGRLNPTAPMRSLAHERPVLRARFVQRADDAYRLMTIADKRVYFWNAAGQRDERHHDDWVTEANVSDDGETLVSASSDGTARVWSSRAAAPIAVLRGHRNEVNHAFFGPGGVLITSSSDRTLRRWRLAAPQWLAAERHWLHGLAVSPDGRQAALCGEPAADGHNCQLLSLPAAGATPTTAPTTAPDAAPLPPGQPLEAVRADQVQALSISPDGQWLLGQRMGLDVYGNTRATLWRLASRAQATPRWLAQWQLAQFNPGQPELVTANSDGQLALWPQAALTQESPKPLQTWEAGSARNVLALSPDGRWLAAAEGARITLWDRRAPQQPPLQLAEHQGDVRHLVFSADSSLLASASTDRTARLWPMANTGAGTGPQPPPRSRVLGPGHSAALWSVAFSPDGQTVVTASADNSLRLWDSRSAAPLGMLARHSDAVNAAVVLPDGQRILSTSDDGTAVLGRCEACRAPIDRLRPLAAAAALPEGERARIADESAVRWRAFMAPAATGTAAAGR